MCALLIYTSDACARKPQRKRKRTAAGSSANSSTHSGATEMAQQATVLLRNLHEASTHASVAAALAEFGPVKRVDVIRGRGFGFVKFATAADAQKAVRAGRENGIDVDGAVVEVALARDKGQKHPNAVAAPIAPSNNEKRESQRSVRGRSARVFGIPAGASDKAVYKRLRKLEGFEKVTSVEGEAAPR